MAHERREFMKLVESKRAEGVLANQRNIQQVAQAEVPLTAVTGDANWDFLLSILEDQIQKLEANRLLLQDAADSDPSFAYEDLARSKAQKMQVSIQIDTLQRVRDLPKQIIEKGKQAKLVLAQYADE